jgi:hypothetical protein
MEKRDSRLFIVITLALIGTLLVGLVAIGGLVAYRLLLAPTEVALPPEVATPTQRPLAPATPTPSPATSPTAMPLATATLVMPASSSATQTPRSGAAGGNGTPGADNSEMPETGLGLMESVGLGLALVSILGGTRMARRWRSDN